MTFDYVPEKPRIERERITRLHFKPLPNGRHVEDVLGGWIVTFENRDWTFDSWAVAVEFVADGGHLHRRSA